MTISLYYNDHLFNTDFHFWHLKTWITILKASNILKQHMFDIHNVPATVLWNTTNDYSSNPVQQISDSRDVWWPFPHNYESCLYSCHDKISVAFTVCRTLCTSVSSGLLFYSTKQEHRCLAVRHSTIWSRAQRGLAGGAGCNMSCFLNNLYTDEDLSNLHTLTLREEPQTRLSINNEAPSSRQL
jgi:hypothetical protein